MNAKREPEFPAEFVRDVSEKVYRQRLRADSGAAAVDRMLAEDNDGGIKLRNRAGAYDALTRAYLRALEIKP